MKKIIASVLALLTICGSQTFAADKFKVKKVVSNVCTKVLPAVAVTAGVGLLAKKMLYDNNSPEKISERREAYDKGVRYIEWHDNMCWFNASILELYYNEFYREKLLNFKDTGTQNSDYDIVKKLSNLIKKITYSESCMVSISNSEYKEIINALGRRIDGKFGEASGSIYSVLVQIINEYFNINPSLEQKFPNNAIIVYSKGHYYNLYYDKEKDCLYSIGKSTFKEFSYSVQIEEECLRGEFNRIRKNGAQINGEYYILMNDNKLITMAEYYNLCCKK